MRILVLTQMYPPHHLGGYELSCADVVDRWRARGHEVEVLTTTFRVPHAVERADSAPVRRELGFYWRDHKILKPALPVRLRTERANQRALRRAVAELQPDVVSVWHMGAMSLGLLQTILEGNLPLVLVVADQWLVYGPAVDAWTRLFMDRPRLGGLVRKITGVPTSFDPTPGDLSVCFASDWLRRRTFERSRYPLGRTTVTYLGFDPASFPTAQRQERPWSWRLLYVGRVEERKGVHVAIEALAHLPEATTLEVVGPADDRYAQRLRRIAARLGVEDRVRFVGSVDRNRLHEHYRAADAFVFPVLWDEPFGIVPLEAMACGTPVVATGTGGSAEFLVGGSNCVLTAKGDAKGLADAVGRLASDTALRSALIDGGSRTVAQLDTDALADVLETWHVAAAHRFRDGDPPDRPSIRETIAPSAIEPDPDA